MRKLTKASLSELAKSKEIISFLEQKSYVGGGSGTRHDPYSIEEYNSLVDNSNWNGGWVLKDQDSNPIYVGGTQADTEESYNGGTDFSGGTKYNGGTDGNGDVAYDGKTRYDGGTNGDVPYDGKTKYDGGTKYDGKTKYDGGTFENRDNPHGLDEVVAIGHRPSNPNPALGYDSMSIHYNYTGSTHSTPSYDSNNYASGETYVTNAGGGGGGHTSGSNSSSGGRPKANTGPKLSNDRFYAMEKYVDPYLFDLIKKEWEKGNVRVNTNPEHNNVPAYYDTVANKFFINKASYYIPNNYVIAHEYTHYLQDKKKILPPDAKERNFNREMQADVVAAIFGYRFSRDFEQFRWMSTETKEEIMKELNIVTDQETKKEDIYVTQELWSKLHNKNFILKLQREWRTYYKARPNTPKTYLEGEQKNWDYQWSYFFEKLDIKQENLEQKQNNG